MTLKSNYSTILYDFDCENMKKNHEVLRIKEIFTEENERRKGSANDLLRKLIEQVKPKEMRVFAKASLGKDALSQEELEEFLLKFNSEEMVVILEN